MLEMEGWNRTEFVSMSPIWRLIGIWGLAEQKGRQQQRSILRTYRVLNIYTGLILHKSTLIMTNLCAVLE